MNITWVTRSFLDYRIPVFTELNQLCGGNFTLLYFADVVPERVRMKASDALGTKAIGLSGEWRFGGPMNNSPTVSTRKRMGIVTYHPDLIKNVRLSQPDVIVTDGLFQWTYAAIYLHLTKNIPYVMCYEPTQHTERHAQWFRKLYRRLAIKTAAAVCCNGSLCKEYTKSLGYPCERITTGHMAADTEGLVQATVNIHRDQVEQLRSRIQADGTIFLYVGRIIQLKGIKEMLKAWQQFQQSNAQVTLLLVGEGPERPELEYWCKNQGLSSIIWCGQQSYDELACYYRLADCFIIPTLADNWSLVVPEAMACGLPIACSIYNGCHPELVSSQNGWTFDPLDLKNFVETLRLILSQKQHFHQIGEASRRMVAAYSPASAAKAIYQSCQQAIEFNIKGK